MFPLLSGVLSGLGELDWQFNSPTATQKLLLPKNKDAAGVATVHCSLTIYKHLKTSNRSGTQT